MNWFFRGIFDDLIIESETSFSISRNFRSVSNTMDTKFLDLDGQLYKNMCILFKKDIAYQMGDATLLNNDEKELWNIKGLFAKSFNFYPVEGITNIEISWIYNKATFVKYNEITKKATLTVRKKSAWVYPPFQGYHYGLD